MADFNRQAHPELIAGDFTDNGPRSLRGREFRGHQGQHCLTASSFVARRYFGSEDSGP